MSAEPISTRATSPVTIAGRYELGDLLGSGGVAHVHRARDLVLHRDVAIKLFGPGIDPRGPERERAEMRMVANLSHPHLVTVHDAGTDDDHVPPRAYLVMALVDGPSLARRLDDGPLHPRTVRRLGLHVADALAHVHARDVVHRDVKPANVLLDSEGTAYLADFGVAQVLGAQALTATGMTVGTAAFLSPEQVRGAPVTPAADVYALGLVLLEALTGQREYAGTSAEAAVVRLSRPPVVSGRVPPAWEALLVAATRSDPAERPSAAELVVALQDEALDADRVTASAATVGATATATRAPAAGDRPDRTRLLTQRVPLAPTGPARPAAARGRLARLALPVAAAVAALLVVALAVSSLGGTDGGGAGLSDPPAGAPGPDRLGPDLDRLQQLVQP